jgi:hypothetical protein
LGKRFLYHDKFTNIVHWSDYDPSTKQGIHIYEGDAEPHLEYSKVLRNDQEYSKRGIKSGMWHAAHYPPSVMIDMRVRFGVDCVNNPKEALEIAKVHYPHCLTVEKRALEKTRS